MRKRLPIWIVAVLMLAGGILCAVRWRAWFVNPEPPTMIGEATKYRFYCFGDDSIPGFVRTDMGWQDTIMSGELRLIVLGDNHNRITRTEWEEIYARHENVDAYIQVGDLMDRMYPYYREQLVVELKSTPFEHLPLATTPGNHEYTKGLVRRLSTDWYDMFQNPMNGPLRFQGSSYYVDFPNLRLIMIDTNGLQLLSDFTRVHTWLRRTIRTAGDRFVIVGMHHPVYSVAKGRWTPLIYLTFHGVLKEADLVFSGHDHLYHRYQQFVNTGCADSCYSVVTVDADSLTMATYPIRGNIAIDQMTLSR